MKQEHGGDIYQYSKVLDFSTSVNPYGPPKGIVETLKKCAGQINTYPDTECRKLREALAQKLEVEKRQLVMGNGAADLIFSLCQAVKPKKALIPVPSFLEYERALKVMDCKITFYETHKEEGFCLRSDFIDAITKDVDIVFLCNPGNPTGAMINRNLLKDIIEKCQETETYVVVDECFIPFIPGAKKNTVKHLAKSYDRLFVLNAFTKIYGMPGIRLGFGLTGNLELLERIKRVTQPWNISTLAQAAGIAALQEDKFIADSLKKIEEEKRRMIIALSKGGYLIYESAANYIFFEGNEDLAEQCLKKNILIRDCGSFRGLEDGYYRISVRTRWENEMLLKILIEEKQKAKET